MEALSDGTFILECDACGAGALARVDAAPVAGDGFVLLGPSPREGVLYDDLCVECWLAHTELVFPFFCHSERRLTP